MKSIELIGLHSERRTRCLEELKLFGCGFTTQDGVAMWETSKPLNDIPMLHAIGMHMLRAVVLKEWQ